MPVTDDKLAGLLPCPFCGGYPVASDRTIWCPNKDCWGPNVENYANMEDARTAWNLRALPASEGGGAGLEPFAAAVTAQRLWPDIDIDELE